MLASIAAASLSVWLMGLTLKARPGATGNAVWACTRAAGTAIVGRLLHHGPATLVRVTHIWLVVAGTVGL